MEEVLSLLQNKTSYISKEMESYGKEMVNKLNTIKFNSIKETNIIVPPTVKTFDREMFMILVKQV